MRERTPGEALSYLWSMLPKWAPWMTVNLLLALVPLVLALVLFRPGRRTGPLWWFGVVVFVLFLPNAPYLLSQMRAIAVKATDLILKDQPQQPTDGQS